MKRQICESFIVCLQKMWEFMSENKEEVMVGRDQEALVDNVIFVVDTAIMKTNAATKKGWLRVSNT